VVIAARRELVELIKYLQTDKFTAVGCDFVHVSTDLMPKLMSILGHLQREESHGKGS